MWKSWISIDPAILAVKKTKKVLTRGSEGDARKDQKPDTFFYLALYMVNLHFIVCSIVEINSNFKIICYSFYKND